MRVAFKIRVLFGTLLGTKGAMYPPTHSPRCILRLERLMSSWFWGQSQAGPMFKALACGVQGTLSTLMLAFGFSVQTQSLGFKHRVLQDTETCQSGLMPVWAYASLGFAQTGPLYTDFKQDLGPRHTIRKCCPPIVGRTFQFSLNDTAMALPQIVGCCTRCCLDKRIGATRISKQFLG